jgi:hypothetical protein
MDAILKTALWVGGATIAVGAGAWIWQWQRQQAAAQVAAAAAPAALPVCSVLIPELPSNLTDPVHVFTTADNNTTVAVTAGSRVDVVLPNLIVNSLTWDLSYTGATATTLFDLYIADSSQTPYAAVNNSAAIYVSAVSVGAGASGSTSVLRYDLKDASGNIQSTVIVNLTVQ